MKYETARAFRQALQDRLTDMSLRTKIALPWLYKLVAFDRFLARLARTSSGTWVLKEGLALHWRLGDRARMTKDIDATVIAGSLERARSDLVRATSMDLGDWFTFETGTPTPIPTGAPEGGLRFPIRCLLAGKDFTGIRIDVGVGDPIPADLEEVSGPALLEFAGIPPARILCYPLNAQIAEKLHAYTRQYAWGESTRVKDVVDILLIATYFPLKGGELARALKVTFEARKTHPLPNNLLTPPGKLSSDYDLMAKELHLPWETLDETWDAAARFLNPMLQGAAGKWSPSDWKWQAKG